MLLLFYYTDIYVAGLNNRYREYVTWKTSDPPLSLPLLSRNLGENISGIVFYEESEFCIIFRWYQRIQKLFQKNWKILRVIWKTTFQNICFYCWITCAIDISRWVNIFWLIIHEKYSFFHENILFWKSLKSMIFDDWFFSLSLSQPSKVRWQKM